MKYPYYVAYRYELGGLKKTSIRDTNLENTIRRAETILSPLYNRQLVIVLYSEPYRSKIVKIIEHEEVNFKL